MKRLKIYCETEYLDQFIIEHSKLNQWGDAVLRQKFDQFVSLLGSRVDLILNKTKNEFLNLVSNGPFYQYLANNEHQSTLSIFCNPPPFSNLKSLTLDGNELLLLDRDILSCNGIKKNLNVLVLSSHKIVQEIPSLFVADSITLKYRETTKVEFYDWMNKFIKAPNSWLIINDPFLLKDRYFQNSFPDLLRSIIKDLNKLQGLVFTSLDANGIPNLNIGIDNLSNFLNQFLSKIPFIAICRGKTHNRKFFTNYYFGEVGHSLCLLPQKNAHRTDKFNLYSIFNPKREPNGITGYEIYQNEFEEMADDYKTFKKQTNNSKYAVFKSINDKQELNILK